MNIHEYQAKELLRRAGVPVQPGEVAETAAAAEAIAARYGTAVVIKAQVHAGGRGKVGGVKLVEGVRVFSHLANIGDTRSLILHPASTTHRQLTDEQRKAAGAGDDVVRLSIGLETADDLIRDLDQALEG